MIKKICIAILVLLCACKQNKTEQKITFPKDSTSKIDTSKSNNASNYRFYPNINWLKNIPKDTIAEMFWKEIIKRDSLNKKFKSALANSFPLKNKKIVFLRDSFWDDCMCHKTFINQKFCKTISEPERAALGYLTTLYGTLSYCYYDKAINEEEEEEEYTIRYALNLDNELYPHFGYCSDQFMNYMQFWFRNDAKTLQKIKEDRCAPAIHFGQVVYSFFTKINLEVKENKIYINFTIECLGRGDWEVTWTEKIIFLVERDNIKLLKTEKSEEKELYHGHLKN